MNTAIIVAAGSGNRFGGDTPKQFLKIHGKPLLDFTIEKFVSCESVDKIVLVLASDQVEHFNRITTIQSEKFIKIVVGGETRSESVLSGLNEITAQPSDIIVVHDGARPLISPEEIVKTITEAKISGAACLVGEVTDTIKGVRNGKIIETIDRSNLRRALTPQCFQYRILRQAFDESELGQTATDECFLVEKLGVEISIVEGNSHNFKVTTQQDLELFERILERSEAGNV